MALAPVLMATLTDITAALVGQVVPRVLRRRASTVVPALSAPGVVEAEVRSVRRPLDRVVMVVLAFAS